MASNLTIPDFLQEDADTIHQRMLSNAPADITTIEGDFYWSTTRPIAEELAQLTQLKLQNVIKLPFPQTSYGEYLELIGEDRGVFRKQALKSTGTIKIKGKIGTVIEKGKVASTAATDAKESVEFEFIDTKTIDETGIVYVNAQCTQAGAIGNVLSGSIVLLMSPINGVESVVNDEDFTGGIDIEDDDVYRERIILKVQTPATSGNIGHYKLWATEVNGVGDAIVVPLADGPGTVKVIVLDSNKHTPTQEILSNVIANIEANRPIGASVSVIAATEIPINVSATLQLASGATIDTVKAQIETGIKAYLDTLAFKDPLVRYTRIASVLLDVPDIIDYSNLAVNGGISNIEMLQGQVAILGSVVVSVAA